MLDNFWDLVWTLLWSLGNFDCSHQFLSLLKSSESQHVWVKPVQKFELLGIGFSAPEYLCPKKNFNSGQIPLVVGINKGFANSEQFEKAKT